MRGMMTLPETTLLQPTLSQVLELFSWKSLLTQTILNRTLWRSNLRLLPLPTLSFLRFPRSFQLRHFQFSSHRFFTATTLIRSQIIADQDAAYEQSERIDRERFYRRCTRLNYSN